MQNLNVEINAILYPAIPDTSRITTVYAAGYAISIGAFLSDIKYKTISAIDNLYYSERAVTTSIEDICYFDAVVLMQPPKISQLQNEFKMIERIIEYALDNKKLVFCNIPLDNSSLKRFLKMSEQLDTRFYYTVPQYESIKLSKGIPYKPTAKIIVVGSVISEVETLTVSFEIIQRLSKKKRVLSFTTSDNGNLLGMVSLRPYLDTNAFKGSDQIDIVKSVLQENSIHTHPDIIFIHIAEAMMEYTELITQGYGMVPYFISRIVHPDAFICGFPLNLTTEAVIDSISEDLNGRFGFPVDIAFTTNAIIDATSAPNPEHVSIVRCDNKLASRFVDPKSLDRKIPLSLCVDSNGIDCVCHLLENTMEGLEQVESLY